VQVEFVDQYVDRMVFVVGQRMRVRWLICRPLRQDAVVFCGDYASAYSLLFGRHQACAAFVVDHYARSVPVNI
jgi:hypothetical protein